MTARFPKLLRIRSLVMVALAGALFGYLGNSPPATGGGNDKGLEHRVTALEAMAEDHARQHARLCRRIGALEDDLALLTEIVEECCGVEPPPPPECELDRDCPAGRICLDGRCVEDPSQDQDQDGFTIGDGDCDDNDPDINPAAPEQLNGIDDDCDGTIDEDFI